ncbi:MAG: translation initiation factor IF-2 [Clostridiales bacterium]|nr:translation initiation factor IF-2 [Clostridiales bacterium]
MAKMKVFELKNLINEKKNGVDTIESRHIQAYLEKNMGVKKTHSSNLDEKEIAAVKKHFLPQANTPVQPTSQKPTVAASQKPAGTRGQQASQGQKQAGGTRQGTSASNIKNSNSDAGQRKTSGVSSRVSTQQNQRSARTTGQQSSQGQRQQGGTRQGTYAQNNQTMQRTSNSNRQGQRPQGGSRSQYNQQSSRTAGSYNRQGSQGQRTQGGERQGSSRYGQQGQRTQGQGGSRPFNQNRQRPAGYGNRNSQGNTQGNRSGGYAGANRSTGGQRSGGYQSRYDKKEDGTSYNNNRSAGNRRGPVGRNERRSFDQQILDQKVAEKNDNSNKRNRDRMNKERNYKDRNGAAYRSKNNKDNMEKLAPRKGQFIKPKPVEKPKEDEIKVITVPEVLTIKELSDLMKKPAAAVVKKLFLEGKMVSINSEITFEEAEEIAIEYDIIAEKEIVVDEVEELLKEEEEDPATLEKRPPVVCVMGHVDHGKTSLLDAIRKTSVTTKEAGGITQVIGAYVVEAEGEKITFLDTPGHEAFTSMRMRGAQATDIAILVVAADDGVMPQTVEAINHAKAAGVEIIVAINKIDKPSANIERVKQELTEHELIAEDWGGDTIFVPVSAHTGEGISQLLEMIILTAEMKELKANPDRNARGVVIEAKLDKGRGTVATILIQKGTLHVGDNIAVGSSYGKVRAMVDDRGRRVKEALPSTPVEIIGLNAVPDAGEIFMATDNEKEARNIAETFIKQSKEKLLADTKARLSLDGLFSQIQAGNIKELNLIIKADVQGSVEAMKQSLVKLSNDEVAVRVIHGGVGAINESDVILASTSNAIIIGFNVKPDNAAKDTANREKVDIKFYRVIYNAIDDVEAAMKGMLDPVYEEKVIGHAEVRQTFKASGVGTIAGSYVLDGKVQRGCRARIYRDDKLIHEGDLASLKRFQDDVKEVATGYECGLVFEKYNDIKEGDKVELYIMAEVPR